MKKGDTMGIEEKLIKKRFDPEKRFASLGGTDIDLAGLCRDARGAEDSLRQALKEDWGEVRYKDWETRLHPFAEASDLVIQDKVLIDTYPPLYTNVQKNCNDCAEGPCNLEKAKGVCGLELEPFQARISLGVACRGCLAQTVDTRDLLTYALKEFGNDKEVGFGARHDISDQAVSIGLISGLYVKTLGDLDKALSYGEAQLNKLFLASCQGTGSVFDFENMTLHAGSVLFLIQQVSELVKASCFEFIKCGDKTMLDMLLWPPPTVSGGVANIDIKKPVVTFIGDNFLPAWNAINYLKENDLTEKVEIVGVGSVGLDVARFYDKVKISGTMIQAPKTIRQGFSDVIVASTGGNPVDILGEAKKVQSKVIWVSPVGLGGLEDRTDDDGDIVIQEMIDGTDAVWVRDIDKAGEMAVRVAQGISRNKDCILSEEKVKDAAKKCKDDCDLCFNACPNSLLIGPAIRKVNSDGITALAEIEKGCYICRKCDVECPENIPITDLLMSAVAKRTPDDKFKMRPGRGTVPEDEVARSAFTLFNSPGFCWILSEGGSKDMEEVGWIANRMLEKGCITLMAGSGIIEAARYYDAAKNKYLHEKFTCEYAVKNLVPLGSDTSICGMQDATSHWARTGVHICHYANFTEVADVNYKLLSPPVIIWGKCSDRMYTMAAGLVRSGHAVIIGPVSGFEFKRQLLGNQFDRSKWHVWNTADGRELECEPGQAHMMIPVETKEEAITKFWGLVQKPGSSISMFRVLSLTPYINDHKSFFGELPNDWQWFVGTAADLPIRQKVSLLKELKEKWGWETKGIDVLKIKARDGSMLDIDENAYKFTTNQARFFTKTPKLICRAAKEKLRKEGMKI